MNCPNCTTQLSLADRQGIEIDYCPQCRGVWLDRGELDKIIERTSTTELDGRSKGRRLDHDEVRYAESRPYKKKRESFLGELFDF